MGGGEEHQGGGGGGGACGGACRAAGGEGPGLPVGGLNESGAGQLAHPEAAPPHLVLPTAVLQRAAHASSQLSSGQLEQNLAASLIFFCLSPPTRRELVDTLPVFRGDWLNQGPDAAGHPCTHFLPRFLGPPAKGLKFLREPVPSSFRSSPCRPLPCSTIRGSQSWEDLRVTRPAVAKLTAGHLGSF